MHLGSRGNGTGSARRRADFLPGQRALVVSCSVAVFALVVYTVIPAIAPHFAAKGRIRFATGDLRQGSVVVAGVAAEPLPTETARATRSPFFTSTPTLRPVPTKTLQRARSDEPTKPGSSIHMQISMVVDHVTAQTGDIIQYDVHAENTGDKSFHGALTINVHTPTGTLRCDPGSVVELCTTQGDYDGSSRDPNAAHSNPPGATKIVTIDPGDTAVLYTLRVQVATTAGTVLHNHTHVDGIGSVTAIAGDVTTKAYGIVGGVSAPDILVNG